MSDVETAFERYEVELYGHRIDSHNRPALLFDWFFGQRPRPKKEDMAASVPEVWSGAHLPFPSLGYATWVVFFRYAGYTDDGAPADPPTEPITVYRAAEPSFVHRLAWTGSIDVAERFLEINQAYGDRPRFVYTVTAAPDRVLAHITERSEDEDIVDTRGLHAKRVAASDRRVAA